MKLLSPIAKNISEIPGFRLGFPKPPSGKPQKFFGCVYDVQKEVISKKEKTPQFPGAMTRRRENFRSPTILALVSTTRNKRQPLTDLSTGRISGVEQQIISSIKTFRNKN